MVGEEGPTIAEAPGDSAVVARATTIRQMIREGATGLAVTLVDQWLAEEPHRGELRLFKGEAFELEGRLADAFAEFSLAADALPTSTLPIVRAARLANRQKQPAEELGLLRRAARIDVNNDKLLRRVLDLEWGARELASAVSTADRLLELAPGDVKVQVRKAWCLFELDRKSEAEGMLEAYLHTPEPDEGHILAWTEMMCDRQHRYAEAEVRLSALCVAAPNSWAAWACLGKTFHWLDKADQAIEALRRALELNPNKGICWFDLGVVLRQRGRVADAREAFDRSLRLDPSNPAALRIAGYEHHYEYGDEAFKRVNRALVRMHRYEKKQQVELHYAAAKAMEDVDELDTAFDHYAVAGQLHKELLPWSEQQMNGVLAVLRQFVSRRELDEVRAQGTPTRLPVFVFGMPRSGTTLVEQVLASHAGVFGAGELKIGASVLHGLKVGRVNIETADWRALPGMDHREIPVANRGETYLANVGRLAGPGYARIVDKMPGNYHWAGLLDTILPGSYLIHCRRHPVDSCLSQYRIFFPDGIPYSYDLRDLGRAYRQYHAYMLYWSKVLPKERILHVRYEDMVGDIETQARSLINFVDLPWDEACLRFYETDRIVKTASVSQVRRPVYADGIGRWHRFKPFLGPLLEELGPLVKEYEDELAGERLSPFA